MKPSLFALILLAACAVACPSLYAQDSSDQPLGDVVRKDQAKAKPKAKVTLDEDQSQPATAPASTDSSAGSSGSSSASQSQDAATQGTQDSKGGQASDKPSKEDQIKDLDRQASDINTGMSELQDKIDHSDATEETKRIWREALVSGQNRLDEIQKQETALKNPQGQSGAPAAPSQPASNPQQ